MDAVIIGIVVCFAIFTEFMLIKAFSYGVKVGKAKNEAVPEPFKAPSKPKKQETSPEMERLSAIMQNIDAYDGTSIGQKEIPSGRTY